MALPKKTPRRRQLPKKPQPRLSRAARTVLREDRHRFAKAGVKLDGIDRPRSVLPIEQQFTGIEKFDGAAVVYQLEHVRCGKQSCKSCRASGGHGPYWYAYWTTLGRTRSLYIGKELRSVAETLDRRAARRKASNG